jgi:hypothetical protein
VTKVIGRSNSSGNATLLQTKVFLQALGRNFIDGRKGTGRTFLMLERVSVHSRTRCSFFLRPVLKACPLFAHFPQLTARQYRRITFLFDLTWAELTEMLTKPNSHHNLKSPSLLNPTRTPYIPVHFPILANPCFHSTSTLYTKNTGVGDACFFSFKGVAATAAPSMPSLSPWRNGTILFLPHHQNP